MYNVLLTTLNLLLTVTVTLAWGHNSCTCHDCIQSRLSESTSKVVFDL